MAGSSLSTPADETLIDRIAETLRTRLITGELMPGQQLSETALSASLDISRNTLREVFRVLTHERLMTHKPRRGVFVTVPSIAAIIDVYRVRRMIECQSLAHATPTKGALRRLAAAVEDASARRAESDWVGVGTANMEFHSAIVALSDSERLTSLYANISAELRLAFGLLDDPESLHAPYISRNREILDLYTAGRTNDAAAALENYLITSERTVLAAYARRVG